LAALTFGDFETTVVGKFDGLLPRAGRGGNSTRWFNKKVEISVPDSTGGVRKVKVSQKQFDQWAAQGKPTKVEGIAVHILDVMTPERTEIWEIGKDVSREIYEKYKAPDGDLYVSIHYEAGKPQMNVATKEAWDRIKAAVESA
jgi:hypothetical protein